MTNLANILRREKTYASVQQTQTFNAPGIYVAPYGKTTVRIGGRGASGTSPTPGNVSGTNSYTNPITGGNASGSNPNYYNPSSGGNVSGDNGYWVPPVVGYEYTIPGNAYSYYSSTPGNAYSYYNTTPGNQYSYTYYTYFSYTYYIYDPKRGPQGPYDGFNTDPATGYGYNPDTTSGPFTGYNPDTTSGPFTGYNPATYAYNPSVIGGYQPGNPNYNPVVPGNVVPGNTNYNPVVPGNYVSGNPNYNPDVAGSPGAPTTIASVSFPGGATSSLAPTVPMTNTTLQYTSAGLSFTVPPGGYVTFDNY